MAPGSFLLDMLNRSKEQGELVAETETRSAVFVARRPSVRARMASCPFDDPPSWWMVKKCVPDQKIVIRWEGDGEEAYEVPLPVEVQSFLAMSKKLSKVKRAFYVPKIYGSMKKTCSCVVFFGVVNVCMPVLFKRLSEKTGLYFLIWNVWLEVPKVNDDLQVHAWRCISAHTRRRLFSFRKRTLRICNGSYPRHFFPPFSEEKARALFVIFQFTSLTLGTMTSLTAVYNTQVLLPCSR